QDGFPLKNTMLSLHRIDPIKPLRINTLTQLNTMPIWLGATWYQAPNMASGSGRTIYHAIKKGCLAMRKLAR
ncbi:hypothetical protein KW894_28725, partial [Klebsiella pneumoniae]|uniref:hypothetical protein n=1 Tax=Klebsiella pneumoniae TaxID=573 RepID=UPI001F058CDB